MIEEIKKEIQNGDLPIHLNSIRKKDKSNFVIEKKMTKLVTSKFQLSPHYKATI